MGTLGIVALVVQLLVVGIVVGLFVALAVMPGRIARKRGHPQAEAISVLGWVGALTAGVGSAIAIVWAFVKPVSIRIESGSELVASSSEPAGEESDS